MAACAVVNSPLAPVPAPTAALGVAVSIRPAVAHTTAPDPSFSQTANSTLMPAFALALDSQARMLSLTKPASVKAVSGLLYHSMAVPPAVAVHWVGATQPVAEFVTAVTTPPPRAVHISNSVFAPTAGPAVLVGYRIVPVGSVRWQVKVSVKVT